MQFNDSTFSLILIVGAMAFLPILAVSVTAFAKTSVVFFIVRNALGIQQLPPNIVVYSLSVILSAYIAMPMLNQAYRSVETANLDYKSFTDWQAAASKAEEPLKSFLTKHADPKRVELFVKTTAKIWPESEHLEPQSTDLSILVPAFLLTQLTQAFEMGFLLYLPFMAIDIIVTAILIALGMMMIPPTSIAIPFKLMLFVEGWTKIVQGLLLSYT